MRRETGGFELASTITLELQANRLTKCASEKIIEEPNSDCPSYLLNKNILTTTQIDFVLIMLGTRITGTLVTPLNSPLSTPVLDRQIETSTIGQQQASLLSLENQLFLSTILKKPHQNYTTLHNVRNSKQNHSKHHQILLRGIKNKLNH